MSGTVDPLALLPPGAKLMPPDPMALLPAGAKLMPPDRSLLKRGVRGLERGAEATAAGLAAPIVGLSQAIDAPLSRIPGLGFLRRGANRAAAADIAAQNAAPIPGFVASTFNPLYLALPEAKAATAARTLARAAGLGGAVSAAQPAAGTHPSRARLENAVAGATLGGALGGASSAATRLTKSPAARLIRQGVRLSTPDLFPEGASSVMNKFLGLLPARFTNASQQARALRDYNEHVLYPWVLAPIGGHVTAKAGRAGVRAIHAAASAEYDRILDGRLVTLPSLPVLSQAFRTADPKMLAVKAINDFGLGPDLGRLATHSADRVIGAVRQELIETFAASAKSPTTIPGRALKKAQSDLRDAALRMLRSSDLDIQDGGSLLMEFASNLTAAVADANPTVAKALRAADDTWHRLALVEQAADQPAGRKGEDEAIVTPRAMLNSMRRSDPSARHARWLRGLMPWQRMFEEHRAILSEPANTQMLGLELGAGTAATLAGGAYNPLAGVMGFALGTVPFTRPASALGRAVVASPRTASLLSRAVAPTSAAVAGDGR